MQLLSFTNALLLAGGALAAPSQTSHSSLRHTIRSDETTPSETTSNSTNWAGAIVSGTNISSVTATWTVPLLTTDVYGQGSSWIGIDGSACKNSVLQTGFDWSKSGGRITYYAWYEWYPDPTIRFKDFPLNGGDVITATITASSPSSGTATLENVSQGKIVSHTFTNFTGEEYTLCQVNAEWILERVTPATAFIDFDTFVFMNATAEGADGRLDIGDAKLQNIKQPGGDTLLTDCSRTGSEEVTCKWLST